LILGSFQWFETFSTDSLGGTSNMGTRRPSKNVPPDGLPTYRLLTGPDDAAFCRRVSEALALGYKLYGSPTATFNGKEVIVAQAIIWPSIEDAVATFWRARLTTQSTRTRARAVCFVQVSGRARVTGNVRPQATAQGEKTSCPRQRSRPSCWCSSAPPARARNHRRLWSRCRTS